MSIPAGQLRKSRIQWHDDRSPQRARNAFMADGSPYRALGLAAILGALSIAAVVAVIQFQRQGGLPDVGSTLVEQAQASPAAEQTAAALVNEPQNGASTTTASESTAQPPANTVQAPASESKVETAKAGTTAARARSTTPAVAAIDQVEAIRADEAAAAAIEPLPVADPRWQAVETASIPPKIPGATPAETPDEPQPMAFAAIEPPAVAPAPKPAQRSKKADVSAEKPQPELVAANTAAATAAKVRSSVFLRSRPVDGASVLVTIPGGASVQVDTGCRHWCAVTYQGKRGFVYKSFLSR